MNPIKRIFSHGQLRSDASEEIYQHLDEKIEELVRQGMSREHAIAAARRAFGNVTLVEERSREVWSWSVVENLLANIRYAARQLRKSRVFAVTAILTLALGIGATTAIFSVINAVILRPLPFADPDRLLSVRSLYTRGAPRPDEISYPNFFDFRAYNHVFEHLVSYRDSEFTLNTPGRPLHLDGEIVSWDLFPLLGVSPARGRGFLPQEEKPGSNVVVLSYGVWKTQFAGDPEIIGRSIVINGKPFTVVGIAPKGFRFPVQNQEIQLWTTLAQDATVGDGFDAVTVQRGARMLDAIGRLKPGVTAGEAAAEMNAIVASLAKKYPDENKNVAQCSIKPELEELIGSTREPLLTLMGAVGLLMLIASLNVANLLLSRTAERAREFALRAAIGASRGVIIRQLLTESLFLAFLGSIGGILLAIVFIRLLVPLAGDTVPRLYNTHVDLTVFGFCIALALITAVLFSLAPIIQTARVELVTSVKEGALGIAGGPNRIRSGLVVAQVTFGLVLLSGSSLLAATFLKLESRDPGFKPDHLLAFSVGLPEAQYPLAKQIIFDDRLIERLSAIPGVQSAASGWPLPLEADQVLVSFDIRERHAAVPDRPHADLAIVTPGFFHTLTIPLLKGRAFTERDDAKAPPVIIVNEAFANRFFPGEDPIGKQIQSGAEIGKGPMIQTIVGVVGNAKQSALNPDFEPIYYFPYKQLYWGIGYIILRTSLPPRSLESAARAAIASLDPQVPMYKVTTMEDFFSKTIAQPRFHMWLLGSFAGIALLLTLVGLYGVMAYSVAKRTREIAVRIAVGASRGTILNMIFRQAALLVIIGILIGVAGAAMGDRLLEGMLYGARLDNSLLLAIACTAMAITGIVATYLPARHAASIDPAQTLRVE